MKPNARRLGGYWRRSMPGSCVKLWKRAHKSRPGEVVFDRKFVVLICVR